MKKPGIPAVAGTNTQTVLAAMKENIEQITGVRAGMVQPLAATATLAQVIAKVNELIDRLMNK